MAEKKAGVVKRRLAICCRAGSSGRPGIPTCQMPPRITIGRKLMYAAAETPGSRRVSVST